MSLAAGATRAGLVLEPRVGTSCWNLACRGSVGRIQSAFAGRSKLNSRRFPRHLSARASADHVDDRARGVLPGDLAGDDELKARRRSVTGAVEGERAVVD